MARNEVVAAAVQADAKHRPLEEIQADLDAVRAEIKAAMPRVEADWLKARRQQARIDAAQRRWKLTHEKDEPFDPHAFVPPLVPYQGDATLQRQFHQLHYKSARYQAELARAAKTVIV